MGKGRTGSAPLRRPLAALLVIAGLVLAACTSTPSIKRSSTSSRPTATPALPSPSGSYDPNADPVVQVVQKVAPAVVNVTTRTLSQSVIGGSAPGKAVGTGFIIRSDGFIVTNFHVVEGALTIKVTLPAPDSRTFGARVVGGDSEHDLAVLHVAATGLPTVPMGDSNHLELGERVIALGYALALPGGPTVTTGIISALDRTIQAADPEASGGSRTYQDVLQTDAAINPGNSGGPLVDLNGNVVGINTAGAGQAENVGFSIAIDAAKPIIDEAIKNPEKPTAYLGVSTTTVGPGVASQFGLSVDHGALVVQLAPGGPANKAGIKTGDVIVAFDGKAVSTSDGLGSLILAHKPGDQVTVKVVRADGTTQEVTATLGARPLPATG